MLDTHEHRQDVLWEEKIPGGCHWSGRLKRGMGLRLTALGAGANISVLLFNDDDRSERYNMADTLKAQHTATLSAGHVLMSDMGRVLVALVSESVGGHDPFCGASSPADIARLFGARRYQEARNEMYRSGQEGLLIELSKWGLGREDMVTPLNFFSSVAVDSAGGVGLVSGHAGEGDYVEWAAVMNVLCVVSTAPHPLDIKGAYAPAGVRLAAYGRGASIDENAALCPENARAFLNTTRYLGE